MKRLDHLRILLFSGLLLLIAGLPERASEGKRGDYFQERANLAVREAAHRMLMISGDSTSRVPAVRTRDGLQFIVRFPGELRYDTLRSIIDETLEGAGLPLRYDLSVYDCVDESLILGFVARPQNSSEKHPCQDREPVTRCVDLAIRFPGQDNQFAAGLGWLSGIGLLLGLAILGLRLRKQSEQTASVQTPGDHPSSPALQIGNSWFHPQEHRIIVGKEEKVLTYREAKLLHYFCQHSNKVLPRDKILEAVWGEEGVQVTRSLDVFVSRLRKILKKDPLVRIASVHGVGYRMATG